MPLESRPYDAARFLRDDADCDAYLEAAVEDGEPAVIALAEAAIGRWRLAHPATSHPSASVNPAGRLGRS